MNIGNLTIEYVPIDDLKPAEYNPRKASEKEIKDLEANITKFGLVLPILVNSYEPRKNVIIGGHFRTRVAKSLGYTEMPVVYLPIENIGMEQELNIRLNRNGGTFDFDILANMFDSDDLLSWGFDSFDLFGSGEQSFENEEVDVEGMETGGRIVMKFDKKRYEKVLDMLKDARDRMGVGSDELVLERLVDEYMA